MPSFKKPKALKRKNIRRKTGAKSQSKQIMTLTNQLSKLARSQYETINLVWNRANLSVDSTLSGTYAYVCPIPISPCNPYKQATIQTNDRIKWADNLAIAAQPTYEKIPMFGSSTAARNSPEWHHKGSVIKWRLISQEPSFSTYDLFLIQARSRQSDQLITDRGLKSAAGGLGSAVPGSGGKLVIGQDYVSHPDVMGSQFNTKYWKILGRRTGVNFSHPGSTNLATNVNPSNTDPRNNSVIAEGTFKVPAGGLIKNFNQVPNINTTDPPPPLNVSQIGFVDEDNSKTCYLAIINNGLSADLETVNLSLLVKDTYQATV